MPAFGKPVRPITSVHVSSERPTAHRPILLLAQNLWSTKLAYVVFVFVVLFKKQHWYNRSLVVRNQRFRIGRVVRVNSVGIDAWNPVRVVL